MARPDVVLIHSPSVYDFRDRSIFYGPISDVIPSSPVFEMYPIGFLTMAAYLRRHGYRVRIVNLALLMMRSRRFRPETLLRRLHPKLFGIDLHWLPHAHGGPEVAKLLKQLHPDVPIVFGGISASYFHRELIADPSVDFVLRGSVTEPCLLALLREIEGERKFERVPNLTWKSSCQLPVAGCQQPEDSRQPATNNRQPIINTQTFVPRSLDEYTPDLGMMIGSVVSRLDFWTTVPFHSWWRHPITAVFTVRGCSHRCMTCGASDAAFERFMPGHHPLLRSPGNIAKLVNDLASFTRAPIFLVGDLRDGGDGYAHAVLDALKHAPVKNRIIFEFFTPPDRTFIDRISASVRSWGAELSPESHDESIRARLGKANFTTASMDEAIEAMLARRCEQLDLFYMIGLPGQTHQSVMETVDDIERLFRRFDKRLSAFITPMGPFIDPGSDGFEQAEARGYRIRARTLAEHRALLEQRDWESILNYETEWMTRCEIVDATYDAAERLNGLKAAHGRITPKIAAAVDRRLQAARWIRREMAEDRIPTGDIRAFSEGTINDKGEFFPPGAFLRNFRISGIVRLCARELVRDAAYIDHMTSTAIVIAAVFASMLVLERFRPLRGCVEPKLRRIARNLTTGGIALAVATLLGTPLVVPLAKWVMARRVGLLNIAGLSGITHVVVAVILLDYTLWIWHFACHRVAFLWRFHLVHHVDRDLDSSTALRFHFGEHALSLVYRAAQIVIIGASPQAVWAWQLILFASILFHHANVRLPAALERRLVRVIVTPRMHGIHHSDRFHETDSNWSSLLSVWDYLHGTMLLSVPQDEITIGVPAYHDPRDVTLGRILLMPFRRQRKDWEGVG